MITGAIFDIDGVILDSLGIWYDLGKRILKSHGITADSSLSDTLFSMSMEQGAEYLAENYPMELSPNEVLGEMEKMLESFYFYEVLPREGAKELLELMHDSNIPVVAATSSPYIHVKNALERCDLLKYFIKIFTTSETGKSKHSPDIYLEAAAYLNSNPENTMVFEDSLYALKTAASAGFVTVGIHDPLGEKNTDGLKKTAKIYLESPENIDAVRNYLRNPS